MRNIYIVLTYTGTILSKMVKIYTKKEYAHVSIALDEDLNMMYSFGRLRPYNAFIGGFVHEGIDIGTFKRFKNTMCKVECLEVTDEQYEKIKNIIKKFEKQKKIYKFNVIGLFAVALNKRVQRDNHFYCAEFVKYVLEESGVDVTELPELIKPDDFYKLDYSNEVYEGLLREYKVNEKISA